MSSGLAAFIAVFITAATLVAVPVSAQTVAAAGMPLTLVEAEQRAVERNPEIAAAGSVPNRRTTPLPSGAHYA